MERYDQLMSADFQFLPIEVVSIILEYVMVRVNMDKYLVHEDYASTERALWSTLFVKKKGMRSDLLLFPSLYFHSPSDFSFRDTSTMHPVIHVVEKIIFHVSHLGLECKSNESIYHLLVICMCLSMPRLKSLHFVMSLALLRDTLKNFGTETKKLSLVRNLAVIYRPTNLAARNLIETADHFVDLTRLRHLRTNVFILDMISQPTLQYLDISECKKIGNYERLELIHMLPKLRSLKVNYSSLSNFSSLLERMKNKAKHLVELLIDHFLPSEDEAQLLFSNPHIKRLTLKLHNKSLSNSRLLYHLKNNRTLEELECIGCNLDRSAVQYIKPACLNHLAVTIQTESDVVDFVKELLSEKLSIRELTITNLSPTIVLTGELFKSLIDDSNLRDISILQSYLVFKSNKDREEIRTKYPFLNFWC